MTHKPIAFDAYEALAESYASVIDTKPHNAYYERPATLSLLPDVSGKRAEWRGFKDVRVYMPSFRRSLGETLNPVIDAGFCLERVLEPKPTEEFRKADPQGYDELSRQPSFLCIRAGK